MKPVFDNSNNNLTELEVFGLSVKYNLADGHSYISAKSHFEEVLEGLPALWELAVKTPIPAMELIFKNKFAHYFGLNGLVGHRHFSVCPTASNSIDIVGAWARSMAYTIGLVEPTFDNIAQLLRRREVNLEAIPEGMFADLTALEKMVCDKKLDALFMVNPNNPTGFVVDAMRMSEVIEMCRRHNVVLILDTSFRFCHRSTIDEYALLIDSGVPFIILEDTGKQWPTLDTKASLLSYSEELALGIRNIYEELYLCSSNFSLSVIGGFIDATVAKGGLAYMQSVVEQNLQIAKTALNDSLVTVEGIESDSIMSVLWLNIERTGCTDIELAQYLSTYDVAVLPGRYFYWNSHEACGHNHIRIALMKSAEKFGLSVLRLKKALVELEEHQNYRRVVGVD